MGISSAAKTKLRFFQKKHPPTTTDVLPRHYSHQKIIDMTATTSIITLEKVRPNDLLGNLSEDQQNLILDWCEEFSFRDVLTRIAAPPPEGLGLSTHYTSLRRFYLKHFHARFILERSESMEQWKDVVADIQSANLSPFWLLAKEALEKKIFIHLQQSDLDQRDLTTLVRLGLRMEDQRLKWSAELSETERLKIQSREASRRSLKQEVYAYLDALRLQRSRPKSDSSASQEPSGPSPEHV
jgi:hypothetical protein